MSIPSRCKGVRQMWFAVMDTSCPHPFAQTGDPTGYKERDGGMSDAKYSFEVHTYRTYI